MRFRMVLVIAALLLPCLVFAGDKKNKKTVPAVFANAKYVWVKAEDGDAFTPGLLPEDRQAIADVMDALRDWNRYVLTASQDEAELVFIVRKGRLATGRLGGTVGTPGGPAGGQFPGQPRGGGQNGPGGPVGMPGVGVGAEVGPPDDLLEVRMRNTDGTLSSPVWRRTQADGLDAPQVPLMRTLRNAVEKDYPR